MFDYVDLLSRTFTRRRAINPRYSLRAYSRDLGLSASRLSRILRGKHGLSEASATKIAEELGLSEHDRQVFLLSALSQHSRARAKREEAKAKIQSFEAGLLQYQQLTEEEFSPLSSLSMLAMIECFHLRRLTKSAKGFSEILGISEERSQAMLDQLEKRGIVRRRGRGYVLDPVRLTTTNGVPSSAIRKVNHEVLTAAGLALTQQTVDERDFSTLTVAVSSTLIPEVERRITAFRRDLNRFVERSYADSATTPDEVYTLAVQFFRVTKRCSQ